MAVLRYLAEHPGQVVTVRELLTQLWAGAVVTKAVVKESIRTIRRALDDDAVTPQYIETVGREGYRFIGQIVSHQLPVANPLPPAPIFVGRETELTQLHTWLDKALSGERQIVFVTGEPGMGKTAVVNRFREQVRTRGDVTIGGGQCVEHYGQGEAYLPVLEAVGRLCREAGGEQFVTLLRQYAPTWLVQLPGVLTAEELHSLQLQAQGATQRRMLREMVEAMEAETVHRPLVLILEDLHWSDHATLELLAYLGKRRQRMRLLIIATYRPVEVIMSGHFLKATKQELQTHRQCEELRLKPLSKQHVQTYVTERFGANPQFAELAAQIHRHTEGNALFMVNVVEDLLTQRYIVNEHEQWTLAGAIQRLGMPENLQQLITRQLERLSEEAQRVLEVASVAGTEFAGATIAAGLRQDLEIVEEICEELAEQGHFLDEAGLAEWPDGTLSGRYAFRHALYQNVLYERIAEARRVRFHRVIGERLETGYGKQAKEIAAELALHFECGRDTPRAVQYREQAGRNAVLRSTPREAIIHLTRGLELLQPLPSTPEHIQQEVLLQTSLGQDLSATKGYTDPEVEKAYTRALVLSRQIEDTRQLFVVLSGLYLVYHTRWELQSAYGIANQLLQLAQNYEDPGFLLTAHLGLGANLFWRGEFAAALAHLEQGLGLYDPQKSPPVFHTADLRVDLLSYAAMSLWYLGYPDQATKKSHEAEALAKSLSHPFSLAYALWAVVSCHQLRREEPIAQAQAETLITLSTEQEFPYWLAVGIMARGEALGAQQGQVEDGLAQMQQGMAALRALGTGVGRLLNLANLATAYAKMGQVEKGLTLLAEARAFADKTRERYCEAELYRL